MAVPPRLRMNALIHKYMYIHNDNNNDETVPVAIRTLHHLDPSPQPSPPPPTRTVDARADAVTVSPIYLKHPGWVPIYLYECARAHMNIEMNTNVG